MDLINLIISNFIGNKLGKFYGYEKPGFGTGEIKILIESNPNYGKHDLEILIGFIPLSIYPKTYLGPISESRIIMLNFLRAKNL